MQPLFLDATIPRATLAVARGNHGLTVGKGSYNYYIFGYIDSCHYFFKFSTNHNCDDIT